MMSAFFSVGIDEFTKTKAMFCRLVSVLENVEIICECGSTLILV